jgi:hypothetical protein
VVTSNQDVTEKRADWKGKMIWQHQQKEKKGLQYF